MAHYRIQFTPVSDYFFGGEKHRLMNGVPVADYFTVSRPYPQQTGILGMIRYLMLLLHPEAFDGKRITDKTQAKDLIGEKSFSYPGNTQNFGKIKSISPLYFIQDKNGKTIPWYFGPMDYPFKLARNDDEFQLCYRNKTYNAKDHGNLVQPYLYNAKSQTIPLSNLISYHSRIGIEKRHRGDDPAEKFYKIKTARLAPGWHFAVNAEINDENLEKITSPVFLPMGAERKMFKIEIKKLNKEPAKQPPPPRYKRPVPYILCISDCFMDGGKIKIKDDIPFAVTDYVSFRNLKTQVDKTGTYTAFKGKETPDGIERSERYNLLLRGSVMYFLSNDQLEKMEEHLKDFGKENTIGFNQFISIKTN